MLQKVDVQAYRTLAISLISLLLTKILVYIPGTYRYVPDCTQFIQVYTCISWNIFSFLEKKAASAMQNFIVTWNIALHCLSYAKKMTDKEIKAQLIAIINSENLMPRFPDCTVQARKHSVAFDDFARRVEAAAGMY